MVIITKDKFKQIYKIIKEYDEIVIARHISPDPDAIGSQLALKESIQITFPKKKVYAVGAGVGRFKFMGHFDKVDFNSLTRCLLVVLDVPNFHRIDGIEGLTYDAILKIDHHPREDIMGTVDFTSWKYSSAAEMVADVLFNTRLKMNEKIAENLYLGIVSDTERFLFRNTKVHTFEIATRLVKDYKLDIVSIYDKIYQKSINEHIFESYIINNLNITKNGLATIELDDKIMEKFNVDNAAPSVIVNNFNFIKEFIVWCFVTYDEKLDLYKANIRSRGPGINMIASKYHGGGHKFASGARLQNKEEIKSLFKDLDEACKSFNEGTHEDSRN